MVYQLISRLLKPVVLLFTVYLLECFGVPFITIVYVVLVNLPFHILLFNQILITDYIVVSLLVDSSIYIGPTIMALIQWLDRSTVLLFGFINDLVLVDSL